MPKKRTKKEQAQKLAEEIGAAPSDPKQAKPSRKNAKAPKSKAKGEAPVSGKLTAEKRALSLGARVSPPKAPKKAK